MTTTMTNEQEAVIDKHLDDCTNDECTVTYDLANPATRKLLDELDGEDDDEDDG